MDVNGLAPRLVRDKPHRNRRVAIAINDTLMEEAL